MCYNAVVQKEQFAHSGAFNFIPLLLVLTMGSKQSHQQTEQSSREITVHSHSAQTLSEADRKDAPAPPSPTKGADRKGILLVSKK